MLEATFSLREVDRLVITYRYFFDLSEAETAEALGVARGTVKSRLSRALARLGPILRQLGPLVVVGPTLDGLAEAALRGLGQAPLVQSSPRLSSSVMQRLAAAPAGGAGPNRGQVPQP